MLKRIRGLFSADFYVQVWEERLRVTDIASRKVYEVPPWVAIRTAKGQKTVSAIGSAAKAAAAAGDTVLVNPFSHPRTLIADFQVAEKLLRHAFGELASGRRLPPSPRVVIHPLEKLEGGLSEIEKRAFREFAYGAGAREVKVYVGSELSIFGFDYEKVAEATVQECWQ